MKKHILFLIHTLGGGGAEKALVNLVKSLPSDKYEIEVKTVIDTGKYRNALPETVTYSTFISLPKLSDKEKEGESGSLLARPSKLKRAIAKIYVLIWRLLPPSLLYRLVVDKQYDYEVAFLEGISTKIIAGSTNSSAKQIAWVHVDLDIQKKSHAVYLSKGKEQEAYSRFSSIACVSENVKESMNRLFPSLSGKFVVCHNILDDEEIKHLAKCSFPKKTFNKSNRMHYEFCAVGRLNWQKGYDRLIKAASRLSSEGFDNFHITIIGTGTAFSDLQSLIWKNKLQEIVDLIGYQDNPYKYISSADLFVAPSRTEGLSTVVAEALALNCPVLATNCSGMHELLDNNQCSMIVDNSEDGIFQGLRYILCNKEILGALKKRAQECGNPLSRDRGLNDFYKVLKRNHFSD